MIKAIRQKQKNLFLKKQKQKIPSGVTLFSKTAILEAKLGIRTFIIEEPHTIQFDEISTNLSARKH